MGTCLSKKEPSSTDTTKKKPSLKQGTAMAPPPPSLSPPLPEEEAVVKEVLTETPLPSSATTRSNSRRAPEDPTAKTPGKGEAPAVAAAGDDGSEEVSEICSASECFSASTAQTEKRSAGAEEAEAGDEETSAPPPWCPTEWSSPAGKGCQHQRRRSTPGESPARRDPRAANGAGGGSTSSLSPASGPDGRPFPRNGHAAAGAWKGHGDRSGRRSVSPAAKRAGAHRGAAGGGGGGVSRSSSMRKAAAAAAASPRRPRPAAAGAAEGDAMGRRSAAAGRGWEGAPLPPSGQKESVENPLVSLECFIFL